MLRQAAPLLVLGAALAGCASAPPRVAYVEAEPYPAPQRVVDAAPPSGPYAAPPVAYAHPVRPGGVYAHRGPVQARPLPPPAFAHRAASPADMRAAPSRFIRPAPHAPQPRPAEPVAQAQPEPTPRPFAPIHRPAAMQHPSHFATRPVHQPTKNHGWHKQAELDRSRDTADR